jgi:hypothetical protein
MESGRGIGRHADDLALAFVLGETSRSFSVLPDCGLPNAFNAVTEQKCKTRCRFWGVGLPDMWNVNDGATTAGVYLSLKVSGLGQSCLEARSALR